MIAAFAWAGLAVRFGVSYRAIGGVLPTLWVLARFFTVLTNLLVAITMTALASGRRISPSLLAGVTLSIVLVALVYLALLRHELSGAAYLANLLLHYIVPAAMAIYWLVFGPKIGLGWRAPLGWMLYPLTYFAYVLVRGSVDGLYPYPFLDMGKLGLARVVLNAIGIAIAFLLAGVILVALGRAMARRRGDRGPLGQQPSNGSRGADGDPDWAKGKT